MQEYRPIPLSKIDISADNVRHRDRQFKIDELAESILKHGLLQPVVVMEKSGDRYDLIIGQRRLLAHRKLLKEGQTKFAAIPAIVLPRQDHFHTRLYSLGENLHRVDLNRADVMDVIKYLYDRLGKKVERVARELGVSSATVRSHLRLERAATPKMKQLMRDRKLTKSDAERVVQAVPNDAQKMDALATKIPNLTKPEKERLVEAAWRRPKADAEALVEEAKRPKYTERVVVQMTPAEHDALEVAASEHGRSREEVAKLAIIDWLRGQGYYKAPGEEF